MHNTIHNGGQALGGLLSFNDRQENGLMAEDCKSPDDQTKQFLSLLMASQRQISSYIGVLVPDFHDADDIFQQTIAVMWEKFSQYRPGTDFAAWGIRIAYYNILRYRREKGRFKVHYSDSVFQSFCEVMEKKYTQTDEKLSALRHCLQKLSSPDRQLLHLRYGMNQAVQRIAEQYHQSAQSVYRALTRVHLILLRCIRRALSGEEAL